MLTGKKSRAIEIVRAQLDPAATPKATAASTASLWCYLGDLTGETAHYETAWSVSRTCARAKLALGAAAMRAERSAWSYRCIYHYTLRGEGDLPHLATTLQVGRCSDGAARGSRGEAALR